MTLSQIQTFYMVATLGTFQKAAERLNTSQPTVSARIVALESHFGTQLFDRSSHRSQLTPQGRVFLEIARKMLELEALAISNIGGEGELKGVYRIGAADTLALSWLPSFMQKLQQTHYYANFEFQIGASPKLHEELLNHSLDLCFMIGPVPDPHIMSLPLCETPVVIAAAPKLALEGRCLSLQDLVKYRILTFERRTQTYQSFTRAFAAAGLTPKMSGNSSLSFAIALAIEGFGVLAVPSIAIESELKEGKLTVLETDFSPESPQFAASYMSGPTALAAQQIAQAARADLASYKVPGLFNLLH